MVEHMYNVGDLVYIKQKGGAPIYRVEFIDDVIEHSQLIDTDEVRWCWLESMVTKNKEISVQGIKIKRVRGNKYE